MYIAPRLNRKIIQVAFVVNDLELAVCYDHCENEGALYPFWMIDIERRHRGLDMTDLEGLLETLGD